MTSDRAEVLIRPLLSAEVEALAQLARLIWRAHYPGIITPAQIEYMLVERYQPEILRAELERDGVWWDLLLEHGEPKGFSSCLLTQYPGELKLDKLYVHPDRQRRGYGAMMLESVLARARSLGCTRLMLAVNKRNVNAIAAYQKSGFHIEQAVVKDIGAGFVMDDFIMVRMVAMP